MPAPTPEGPGVVLRALALSAATPGVARLLEEALDDLIATVGATAAAYYAEEPPAGGLVMRVRRPGEGPAPEDLLVPARIGGQPVGAIGLALPGGAALGDEERGLVSGVAQALALAVRNDDLVRGLGDRVRELDRQALHLTALTRVARRVAESLDEDEARRVVVAEARALVGADCAVLMVPREAGGPATVAVDGPGAPPMALPADLAAALGDGLGWRLGREAVVAVPGGAGAPGAVMGWIAVRREAGDPFSAGDLERLAGLADQASVALANGRLLSGLRAEQAERRVLASTIVLAQESERRRVAEDLHDGPVQELVGVGLMLDALSSDLADGSPETVADVNRAAAAAREAVRALRRAISDLHPMSLEELGFAAAVRSLVQRIEWRGAAVEVDLEVADALSDTHRTLAFRIVQEAVANIVRHADPRRVTIAAARRGSIVAIAISDDGRGFDPAERRPGAAEGHLGLAAAQERAALAGGHLAVASRPGHGTTLTLTLPAGDDGPAQTGGGPSESRARADDSAAASAKRSSTTT